MFVSGMSDTVPSLGLGTSGNDESEQCAESVRMALEIGYRHLDTAQMYNNETAVGKGIERANTNREDIFVATKIHPTNLSYDDVISTATESFDRLGLEYVDLLYVHWPLQAYDPEKTLAAFDELHDQKMIRHVGVSNFTPDLLREADALLDAPILVNQVEIHPLLPPRKSLVQTCAEMGTDLIAYAPFCRLDALEVPEIETVGERNRLSPAQVCLAWLLEKGCKPIPKATGRAHLQENYIALRCSLNKKDIERIDAVERRYRKFDPDGSPWKE
jgi:2,5-diketo-D-gluconate reductase B